MASQIEQLTSLGQNEKAAIAGGEREEAAALLIGPTNPYIARAQVTSRSAPAK